MYFFSLLFNFQGPIFSLSPRLGRQLCYYSTSFRVCQYLFQNFFNFFSSFLSFFGFLGFASPLPLGFTPHLPCFLSPLARGDLWIIAFCFYFVNTFFGFFSTFFIFIHKCIFFDSKGIFFVVFEHMTEIGRRNGQKKRIAHGRSLR